MGFNSGFKGLTYTVVPSDKARYRPSLFEVNNTLSAYDVLWEQVDFGVIPNVSKSIKCCFMARRRTVGLRTNKTVFAVNPL